MASKSKKNATAAERERLEAADSAKVREGGEINPLGNPVTPELQEARAEESGQGPSEAIVEQHEAAPSELAEVEKVSEEVALAQAEPQAEVAIEPGHPGGPAQDIPAFQAARNEEAVQQGVLKTTQERLYELARAEENAPKVLALEDPLDTVNITEATPDTAAALYRVAREEEVLAEKREEAIYGSPDGPDAIKSMNALEGRTDLGEDVPEADKVDNEKVVA